MAIFLSLTNFERCLVDESELLAHAFVLLAFSAQFNRVFQSAFSTKLQIFTLLFPNE